MNLNKRDWVLTFWPWTWVFSSIGYMLTKLDWFAIFNAGVIISLAGVEIKKDVGRPFKNNA